jgi:DNA-binding transcriptional LysR family regulator
VGASWPLARDHGIPLLRAWTLPPQDLHLIYPSRKYQPQRARALLQFLTERLPQLPGFITTSEC